MKNIVTDQLLNALSIVYAIVMIIYMSMIIYQHDLSDFSQEITDQEANKQILVFAILILIFLALRLWIHFRED